MAAADKSTARTLLSQRKYPDLMSLDVTSGCNLRCLHCYNESGESAHDVSDAQLLDIARQMAELHPFNVCLCGGEPLLRGNLLDVIDILYPNVGRIAMVTNGLLLSEAMAEKLVRHGVYTIQVSLDGAFAWQHDTIRGKRGCFAAALSALDALYAAGLPQRTVSILPTRLSAGYLEEYVQLCLRHHVQIIRSMPFLPSGRGRLSEGLMLDGEGYFHYKRSFFRLRERYSGEIAMDWEDPLSLNLTMPKKVREGIGSYSAEIRANGDLVPSNYLPVTDGNLLRHPLREYWFGGHDTVWSDRRLLAYTKDIHQIYDLETATPRPFGEEQICFDLLEE